MGTGVAMRFSSSAQLALNFLWVTDINISKAAIMYFYVYKHLQYVSQESYKQMKNEYILIIFPVQQYIWHIQKKQQLQLKC